MQQTNREGTEVKRRKWVKKASTLKKPIERNISCHTQPTQHKAQS